MFRCRAAIDLAAATLLVCLTPAALAQPQAATLSSEARVGRALEHARQQGPLALYAFFHDMPKGADLFQQ